MNAEILKWFSLSLIGSVVFCAVWLAGAVQATQEEAAAIAAAQNNKVHARAVVAPADGGQPSYASVKAKRAPAANARPI
jgi:hypothetical protein